MRVIFLLPLIFFGLLTRGYCQNLTSKSISTIVSEKERWNLDKYVWSHTHYQTGKNDKPVIDFEALDNWQTLGGNLSVSRNGQYIAYTLNRGCGIPAIVKKDSLIVQSTDNKWRKAFIGVEPGIFSSDNKQYIFKKGKALYFVFLGKDKIDSLKKVESYKTSADKDWVAMSINDMGVTVVLQNLRTKTEKKFPDAKSFSFDKSGQWFYYEVFEDHSPAPKKMCLYNLTTGKERYFHFDSYLLDEKGQVLIKKETGPFINDNKMETRLKCINLQDSSVSTIWSSTDPKVKVNSYSLDKSGKQVAINLSQNGQNSIWYWKEGMAKAVEKVTNQSPGIDDLLIQPSASFTASGNYIQFSLLPKPDERKPMEDAVQIDIWSSQDKILQSTQPSLLKEPEAHTVIVSTEDNNVVRLEKEYEKVYLQQGDFALIKKAGSNVNGDRFWEEGYHKDSNWVVFLKDGSRYLLPTRSEKNNFWFSPGGSYLVYFDGEKGDQYFSYDLKTKKISKISGGIPEGMLRAKFELSKNEKALQPLGVAAWLEGDHEMLAYDDYDVWLLDLTGKKPAINLTNSYGNRHKTIFSLLYKGSYALTNRLVVQQKGYPSAPVLSKEEPILLLAFNKETKYNGYYKKSFNKNSDPDLLFMGPCFFQAMNELSLINSGMPPVKAADENIWIVQKQTATDAPNYFLTRDFKIYKRLTNIQPQKTYNWLTTELHTFQQLDGTISQGVLYKPRNFDSTKKYPVIITFYGQLSDRLYQYPSTEYIRYPTIFDQPSWMISHGYLVFMPDILFKKDQWGPSTVNTMDGAARYLSQLPFVDGKKIGAAGHSNSGRLGYYLLTHSKSFAAMSLGAGTSDMISGALRVVSNPTPESQLFWAEEGAFGAGLGNLWENKESWIDHTAPLQADRVKSPALIFYNKLEGAAIDNAIEMFTVLRRLEKPVWWLQYDQEGHSLGYPKDLKDFTIRYTQFFDYYLKDAPMPIWMKEGIPYKLKGVESRYNLDSQ